MLLEITLEEAQLLLQVGQFGLCLNIEGGAYYQTYSCPCCYESIDFEESNCEGGDLRHAEGCRFKELQELQDKLLLFTGITNE